MAELVIHLPDDVAERLAVEAASRGMSVDDLVVEIIDAYLDHPLS